MASVKGFIAKAEKNKFGYWSISVGTGKDAEGKTTWANISFKEKGDPLLINGVAPVKGMLIEAEVEGQYNNFVSGVVKEAPKQGFGGSGFKKGGFVPQKSGYDQLGNAVGGSVNRANELLASKTITSKDFALVALGQYYMSEVLKKALELGKDGVKAYHEAFKGVDVLILKDVVTAKNAFEEATKGLKAPEKPAEPAQAAPATPVAPAQQTAPVEAPVKSQPVQQAPVEMEEEEGSPFDDAPDF